MEPTSSPRADWFARHDLIVRDYQNRHTGGWDVGSLNTRRFLCANRAMTRYACGDTEEEAEIAYCERYGLDWWKLAEWNEAMERKPQEVECMEV